MFTGTFVFRAAEARDFFGSWPWCYLLVNFEAVRLVFPSGRSRISWILDRGDTGEFDDLNI